MSGKFNICTLTFLIWRGGVFFFFFLFFKLMGHALDLHTNYKMRCTMGALSFWSAEMLKLTNNFWGMALFDWHQNQSKRTKFYFVWPVWKSPIRTNLPLCIFGIEFWLRQFWNGICGGQKCLQTNAGSVSFELFHPSCMIHNYKIEGIGTNSLW